MSLITQGMDTAIFTKIFEMDQLAKSNATYGFMPFLYFHKSLIMHSNASHQSARLQKDTEQRLMLGLQI